MTPDRNHRGGAAQRTSTRRMSARRMTWTFIGITIVMSGLTLALPYVIHRIGTQPAQGAARAAPNGQSVP